MSEAAEVEVAMMLQRRCSSNTCLSKNVVCENAMDSVALCELLWVLGFELCGGAGGIYLV